MVKNALAQMPNTAIKTHPQSIDQLTLFIEDTYPKVKAARSSHRSAKSEFNNALMGVPAYKEASLAYDRAKLGKQKAKLEAIKNSPRLAEMERDVIAKREQVAGLQLTLSDALVAYGDETGKKEFDFGYGKPLIIKRSAKL